MAISFMSTVYDSPSICQGRDVGYLLFFARFGVVLLHRLIAETSAEFRSKYHFIFVGSGIALDEAQTERLFEPTLLNDSWEV